MSYSATEPGTLMPREAAENNYPFNIGPFQRFFPQSAFGPILNQTNAVGLRFHFPGHLQSMGSDFTPDSSSVPVFAVAVQGDRSEIYTPTSLSYLRSNEGGAFDAITREAFEAYLPPSPSTTPQYYCAFFSRWIISTLLAQVPASPNRGLYILPGTHLNSSAIHPTMIAAAGDSNSGAISAYYLRSELPCPPHCGGGTDYSSKT